MFEIGPDSDTAAVYRARFARRLPVSLSELTGPEHGLVELPLHVAWSGLRVLDLDRPRQRMSLYRTVLTEGMRDDLCRFLSRDVLLDLWPTMYPLIGRAVREVWEEAFPELRAARASV
ncbi:hypothetical protein [Streptomyces fulvoviolaceus]|uniref:hypothetical protein n=1 Tax=Streptomyces fulvoviolaceus TaxID=285535 RepID=UPI000693D421|nr:hypothetical protein [Streptomyces fulvoviolaceus]